MDDSSSNEYDSSTDSSAPSSPEDSSLGGSDNSSSSSEESLDPLTKLEDCKVELSLIIFYNIRFSLIHFANFGLG